MNDELKQFLKNKLTQEKEKYKLLLANDILDNEEIICILNSIIDLKFLLKYEENDTIYLDLKKFIKTYVLTIEHRESGYDKVNVKLICEKISKTELSLRNNLLCYFKRELTKNAFLDEAIECQGYIYENKILIFKNEQNLLCKIKWLLLLSSKNIKTLSLSFIFLFLIIYVIQLAAPHESMVVFEKKSFDFYKNSFFNDISNIFSLLLDLNDEVKLIPLNFTGILVLGFLKIAYISIFVNYFWKKIVNYIKIEE